MSFSIYYIRGLVASMRQEILLMPVHYCMSLRPDAWPQLVDVTATYHAIDKYRNSFSYYFNLFFL